MKEMTPKERETAVLEKEKPDRVPIWQLNGIVAAHHFGHLWKDVRGDAKLSVDIIRKFSRLSGTDVMAFAPFEPNAIVMDLPGVQVKFQDNNYSNVMSYYYSEPEDIDNKELYDPSDPNEAKNLWKYILNRVALLAEVEEDYSVFATSWSVFTTAGFLRNVENLMMDIMLEPDIAHKIMDKAAVLVDGLMKAGLDKGCDRVNLADPSGSGSLVSGETFEEFASPHLKRMIAGYKKDYGVLSYLHVCGDTLPVAKQMSELGAALFSFDYMNKATDLRDIFGDKAVLAGNLDPMNVVWMGTPESVINASKKCIEDMDGSRFILATGCETPRDTPLENLQAMLTATKKYSKF